MPPYQSSSQDADFRDLIVITQASIMPWLPLLFHFKPGLDVGEGLARQSGQIIINLVTCLCMLGSSYLHRYQSWMTVRVLQGYPLRDQISWENEELSMPGFQESMDRLA
ncbi:hypothetical protein NC652_019999 [Populus alba x Populus x berolinensis]|nr:hypothetical protein NC652_019994 [Populus alba x Populus x berolinensis]KAJ6908898.1 hypothetical protein NC652_019999 [Populus alba x Populus x berolinensis]